MGYYQGPQMYVLPREELNRLYDRVGVKGNPPSKAAPDVEDLKKTASDRFASSFAARQMGMLVKKAQTPGRIGPLSRRGLPKMTPESREAARKRLAERERPPRGTLPGGRTQGTNPFSEWPSPGPEPGSEPGGRTTPQLAQREAARKRRATRIGREKIEEARAKVSRPSVAKEPPLELPRAALKGVGRGVRALGKGVGTLGAAAGKGAARYAKGVAGKGLPAMVAGAAPIALAPFRAASSGLAAVSPGYKEHIYKTVQKEKAGLHPGVSGVFQRRSAEGLPEKMKPEPETIPKKPPTTMEFGGKKVTYERTPEGELRPAKPLPEPGRLGRVFQKVPGMRPLARPEQAEAYPERQTRALRAEKAVKAPFAAIRRVVGRGPERAAWGELTKAFEALPEKEKGKVLGLPEKEQLEYIRKKISKKPEEQLLKGRMGKTPEVQQRILEAVEEQRRREQIPLPERARGIAERKEIVFPEVKGKKTFERPATEEEVRRYLETRKLPEGAEYRGKLKEIKDIEKAVATGQPPEWIRSRKGKVTITPPGTPAEEAAKQRLQGVQKTRAEERRRARMTAGYPEEREGLEGLRPGKEKAPPVEKPEAKKPAGEPKPPPPSGAPKEAPAGERPTTTEGLRRWANQGTLHQIPKAEIQAIVAKEGLTNPEGITQSLLAQSNRMREAGAAQRGRPQAAQAAPSAEEMAQLGRRAAETSRPGDALDPAAYMLNRAAEIREMTPKEMQPLIDLARKMRNTPPRKQGEVLSEFLSKAPEDKRGFYRSLLEEYGTASQTSGRVRVMTEEAARGRLPEVQFRPTGSQAQMNEQVSKYNKWAEEMKREIPDFDPKRAEDVAAARQHFPELFPKGLEEALHVTEPAAPQMRQVVVESAPLSSQITAPQAEARQAATQRLMESGWTPEQAQQMTAFMEGLGAFRSTGVPTTPAQGPPAPGTAPPATGAPAPGQIPVEELGQLIGGGVPPGLQQAFEQAGVRQPSGIMRTVLDIAPYIGLPMAASMLGLEGIVPQLGAFALAPYAGGRLQSMMGYDPAMAEQVRQQYAQQLLQGFQQGMGRQRTLPPPSMS
jgi:hypothetical protein